MAAGYKTLYAARRSLPRRTEAGRTRARHRPAAGDRRQHDHSRSRSHDARDAPTCIEVEPILQRLIGERVGPGWRELVRRKIGRLETCTHLMELLGPAVTTLYQTMSYGKKPEGRDTLENQQRLGERPFFIGGCHSWRTDGPVVAAMFPQFATKPAAKD